MSVETFGLLLAIPCLVFIWFCVGAFIWHIISECRK